MIKTNYWNNNYIKSLNSYENNLLTYLATNDYTNYSGIIKITNYTISADLGFSLELVNDILAKFTNDNICYFDSETNYLIFNKCEFFSFRENLNVKTEIKLKSDFEKLPSRLKDILITKFADLKPYFSEKNMLELTKNIILNLAEIKAINRENEGVSVNNLIMIKNQVEILINDILNQQNEFSPLYNSYILNNIKECTQNKIGEKNTPLYKKNATKETPKTKRGRPKKETKIYADHFIVRDGKKVKVGQIEVVNCDIDGKEIFKPKNKYFKSVVKAEDVNYDLVKNMFLTYTSGWSKEGLIEMSNVIEKYFSKRKSQGWVMNRTLEQDIQKWVESQFSLKPYFKMAENTQIIENIENKFKETENKQVIADVRPDNRDNSNIFTNMGINFGNLWDAKSGYGIKRNLGRVAGNETGLQSEFTQSPREERPYQTNQTLTAAPKKTTAVTLDETELYVLERVYDNMKSRKNEEFGVQGLLKSFKERGELYHNYFVQRGYFYIE